MCNTVWLKYCCTYIEPVGWRRPLPASPRRCRPCTRTGRRRTETLGEWCSPACESRRLLLSSIWNCLRQELLYRCEAQRTLKAFSWLTEKQTYLHMLVQTKNWKMAKKSKPLSFIISTIIAVNPNTGLVWISLQFFSSLSGGMYM